MKISNISIKNFRRLEDISIDFEADQTIFVGPNNSGKTSATNALRLFLDKPSFSIHDFSSSRIREFNELGEKVRLEEGDDFPKIELDLWFNINPDLEYHRVASLISTVSETFDTVGIRLSFEVADKQKLVSDYQSAFLPQENGQRLKPLSHYLSLSGNLSRHYELKYYSLENTTEGEKVDALDPKDGKNAIRSLIRIDFVDAQRNINDNETSTRSNRLSAAFAAYYKKNLEQAGFNEQANQVLETNNDNLTAHYEEHFEGLMTIIRSLGVPSVNDREMRVISDLSPEMALKGNTSLFYVDPDQNHELPEAYNGLGFKNLVYMAIQISHFHLQWLKTDGVRPLCQIICIEEPEVHLHAQVQQTFIANIWKILQKASNDCGEAEIMPQLCLTTHSSHVIDTVDFSKIRYFKRCLLTSDNPETVRTMNGSKVQNLKKFKPSKDSAAGVTEDETETLNFLKKYLKLTHCDLFFADAAVLIEGTVEKLLLPSMIEKSAITLQSKYITTLEVGGAYAHRFASLLEFLGLPYLVITDLDSVNQNGSLCMADDPEVIEITSSNACLEFYLNKSKIIDLTTLTAANKTVSDGCAYITFQKSVSVREINEALEPQVLNLLGRTFEESFIYQNIDIFREKKIPFGRAFQRNQNVKQERKKIFKRITSNNFKKTEFALDIATSEENWTTPEYISEGLKWLESKLTRLPTEQQNEEQGTEAEVIEEVVV